MKNDQFQLIKNVSHINLADAFGCVTHTKKEWEREEIKGRGGLSCGCHLHLFEMYKKTIEFLYVCS